MKFFWIFGIFFKATTSNTVFYFDFFWKCWKSQESWFQLFLYVFSEKFGKRNWVEKSYVLRHFWKFSKNGKFRQISAIFHEKKGQKWSKKKKKNVISANFSAKSIFAQKHQKTCFLSFLEHFEWKKKSQIFGKSFFLDHQLGPISTFFRIFSRVFFCFFSIYDFRFWNFFQNFSKSQKSQIWVLNMFLVKDSDQKNVRNKS